MLFEWDETKRQSNLAKHGVDFTAAKRMLEDMPTMLEDTRQDSGPSLPLKANK